MAKKEKATTAEIVVIEQPEFTEVVSNSKIELTKAQSHALAFAPMMQQYHELASILSGLDKVNPSADDAKKAREARLKMVKIRTGSETIKDERKATILIESNLIQDLYNVVKNTCALTESEFLSIEKHQERIEAERLEKIAESRRLQLQEFGEINEFVDLRAMDDETFGRYLENEKLAFLARKEAAEKAEQARIEAEKKAEQDRLDKIEADRVEQERVKTENEKLRLENEAKEKELAAERKRQADEKAEADRLQSEKDKKVAAELAEQKRLSELQASEAKKVQDAKDAEIAKLKAEQEAEKQRKEKELADQKAKQEAALLAPDKEKVRAFFESFEALRKSFPELTSELGVELATVVKESLLTVRGVIITESKKLL